MRDVTLEFDRETVRQLDSEAARYGFEDRVDYLRWIVANRRSIDWLPAEAGVDDPPPPPETGSGDRMARLERRLDALEAAVADLDGVDVPDPSTPGVDTDETETETAEPEPDAGLPDERDGDAIEETIELRTPPELPDIETLVAKQCYDHVPKTEERDTALIYIYRRLREEKGVHAREICDEFYPQWAVGFGSMATWYRQFVSPELEKLPGVEHADDEAGRWLVRFEE